MSDYADARLESWFKLQKHIGRQQRQVLEIIRGSKGLASFELAEIMEKPFHCVAPRVTELRDRGMIRDSGRRAWNTKTKRRVTIWESRISSGK